MGYKLNTFVREDQIASSIKSADEKYHRQTLEAAVNEEKATRESVDAEIKSDINQLYENLAAEVSLRAQDDLNVKNELQAAIDNEISIRSAENSALQRTVDDETDARTTADNQLRTDYISADSALADAVINRYDPIIEDLTNDLHDEVTLGANRHATLASDLTASIQAEQSARTSDVASLKSAIDSEISTRKSQTDSLGAAVTKEISDRTNAVNGLQTNLSTAIGNEATARAAADTELKTSLQSALSNIQASIKDFTPSTATQDGKAGFVPAPPKSSNKMLLTQEGWEELSSTDVYIGAVPSQNGTQYYTGSTVYPQWINYEDQKMTVSGQTSGANAGVYTVNFTPVGLYCWADGTRTAKSVQWRISPKVAQVPTAAVTEFEYTGNNITLSVTNPNADCVNTSGATWAVNAGSYTITFKLKSTSNYVWSDGSTTDKSINWRINAKKLAKPTASVTAFTYNKSTQGLTVSNYDSNWMTKSGSDSAVAAASYSVTYTLKNTSNTVWSDNTTAAVKIDWSIAVLKLTKPSASTTSFTYDGKSKSLSVSNFNSNYETLSGSTSEINAGGYSATYSLNDTTNTKWADNSTENVVINWSIARQKLSATLSTFSQSGTLTYNGNAQTVSITNYNSSYHELSSETSKTAAGTYTAKVTPKSNFAWSDGTFAAKSVSWSIGVYKLAKPTASKTEFDYTGATFTLDVANYNSNYMTRSGVYSASAEGNYTVTYTLKDTANYRWQDNTSAAVSIDWKIKTTKFAKPTISAGSSQEYTGGTLKPTIANYNATYMNQSGSASGVNVGTYTITYSLKDKTNTKWQDDTTADVTLTFEITRKKLTAAQSTFTQGKTLTYTGNSQEVTINGFNATYHTKSSETSATNAGTYTAKIDVTPNYCWSDGSTATKSLSWSIGAMSLTKPTAATTSFEYDGSVKTLSISNYNSSYMTKSGVDSTSAKGNYEVTFTLNSTSNFKWSDNTTTPVKIAWSIGAKAITKPTISGSTEFTYDGNAKTINVTGYDSDTMILSGSTSQTNAGDYTATYQLRDKANTNWAGGGTDDISLTWKINRAKLKTNEENFSLDSTEYKIALFAYGANPDHYGSWGYWKDNFSAANIIGFDSAKHQYSLGGYTPARKSGEPTSIPCDITVSITPNSNYLFSDGTTNAKTLHFTIMPHYINKPKLSGSTSFVYNGSTQGINVTNTTASVPGKAFGTNPFNPIIKSGVTSAVNVGQYSAVYKIAENDPMYGDPSTPYILWADTSDTATVTINWEITPKKISKPHFGSSGLILSYDGNEHAPTQFNGTSLFGYNATYMTPSGDTSATIVGTYTIIFGLKDKTNTQWQDGSTADVNLQWQIKPRKITKPSLTNATFTYDGTEHSPTINNYYPAYMTQSGTAKSTNAGDFTLTYSLRDKNNYCWQDDSTADITLSWTINKKSLTKPSLTNTTFTYNGTEHAPTINNYDATYMTQSGTAKSTNAGDFTLTFTLKNTTSVQWSDSTSSAVSCTWTINKAAATLEIDQTSPLIIDTLVTNNNAESTIKITQTNALVGVSLNAVTFHANFSKPSTDTVIVQVAASTIYFGTLTITASDDNHTAKTKTLKIIAYPHRSTIGDYSWYEISTISQAGCAETAFKNMVGQDKVTSGRVDFSPMMGDANFSSGVGKVFQGLRCTLLDARSRGCIFSFEGSPSLGKLEVLCDEQYWKTANGTTGIFAHTYTADETVYWHFADKMNDMVNNFLPGILESAGGEFSELGSYIRTEYPLYVITQDSNGYKLFNGNDKRRFFIPSIIELKDSAYLKDKFGISDYELQYLINNYQWDYYANGNSPNRKAQRGGTFTDTGYWLRDTPMYQNNSTAYGLSWFGGTYVAPTNLSMGLALCFLI